MKSVVPAHRSPFRPSRRALLALAAITALLGALAPMVGASARAGSNATHYWVQIRRTEYGIPHILAHDYGSLGYGYGYAFAQDNLCTMAEDYVTVRGERSRFFGPAHSYLQRGNGFEAN